MSNTRQGMALSCSKRSGHRRPSGSSPTGSKDFCAAASAITGAHPLNTLSAFPAANTAAYILDGRQARLLKPPVPRRGADTMDGSVASEPTASPDEAPTSRGETKLINLALQGGGAHDAFAWGVLDRLLDDQRIERRGNERYCLRVGHGRGWPRRREEGARQVLAPDQPGDIDQSAAANLV